MQFTRVSKLLLIRRCVPRCSPGRESTGRKPPRPDKPLFHYRSSLLCLFLFGSIDTAPETVRSSRVSKQRYKREKTIHHNLPINYLKQKSTARMEPPPCIQNAMMTKDKKPFTYTPGGLNLSEIRSPRMARRIERNAAYEGVGTPPPSQSNRPQIPPGSLPPSTLAAMQPQMHVQVFPTGPPPPPPQMNNFRGGNPPPSSYGAIPPPPPPPSQPLPTQKFRTGDQQEVERPDMTRIIPENPMALLRKTTGPKIKNTLLDELYREPTRGVQQQPQMSPADNPRSPPPISNPPFVKQTSSAPAQTVPSYQKQQSTQKQNTPPVQQQQWSPPVIERNETPRNSWQQTQKTQQPERNVNVGSIYIPPLNNQQSKNMASPPCPSPQSPNVQTPGTPTLKEAPKPWQQKQQPKQEEVPEWAKREPSFSHSPVVQEVHINQNKQQQQPRWPQSPQTSPRPLQPKEPEPVYRNKQQNQVYVVPQQTPETQHIFQQYPQGPDAENHPNAVFVTQPIVLQHPGGGYGPPIINRRENVIVSKQEGGARIIPIRVESAESPNQNRQPTWPNNPTQSGGSSERRLPQQPHEEMRKMQLNNSDQDLLNRFKQEGNFYEENPRYRGGHIPSKVFRILDQSDVDSSERFPHGRSTDPRYMGATIPSKAFRLLLHMTNDPNAPTNVPSDAGRNQAHVRNIPIQIEGNGGAPPSQCYVPPSQQTPAEEPKKYTGSSIPSRSFKMLQAMTAHDSCANAKEANRTNYDPPYTGGNWPYPPAYPMCPLPSFWPPYYPTNPDEYASTERSDSDSDLNKPEVKKCAQSFWGYNAGTPTQDLDTKSGSGRRASFPFSASSSSSELESINARKTPVPHWGYPGRTTPVPGRRTPKSFTDSDHESNRTTPIPFWAGYPHPRDHPEIMGNNRDDYNYYPIYPPYYDPYYMAFYYGYPPIFPPAPPMYPTSESEDLNGYSSMDEMSYYNQKMKHSSFEAENRETISTPVIVVTPTPKDDEDILVEKLDALSSDSDTDTEVNEETPKRSASSGALQTIRSVKDINVYRQYEEDSEQSDDEIEDGDDSESSSNSSIYEGDEGDEVVPHQLSVIFEVSERTDISRSVRECSVTSDCTTVEAKSDEENDDDVPTNKEWISDNLMEIALRIQSRINARIELDDLESHANPVKENAFHKLASEDDDIINHCQSQKDLPIEPAIIQNIPEDTDYSQHCLIETKRTDECKSKPQLENEVDENEKRNAEETNVTDEDIGNENYSGDLRDLNEETCDKPEVDDNSKESSDSEDWWGVIGNKEDDFVARKPYSYNRDSMYYGEVEEADQNNTNSEITSPNSDKLTCTDEVKQEVQDNNVSECEHNPCTNASEEDLNVCKEPSVEEDTHVKLETTSTHSSSSSGDLRKEVSNADPSAEVESDDSESSGSEESEDSSIDDEEGIKHDMNNNQQEDVEEPVVQVPSIKDRIKALQESISAKKKSLRVEEEIKICVKSQVIAAELGEPSRSKTISAKSSVKSFDEISEEDSGVTDMSRQFSDNEEFPELKKMTRYQRASTHSRLFQLLQGECENDEDFAMEERKGQLTLPLNASTVSDELADELVHSMLKQKKGQIFRNVSMEKLHAAAKRILQEDNSVDNLTDTPSEGFSEFLSPLRNDTGNSTPQEFYGHYNEYLQYYDSWAQASASQDAHKLSRPFAACLAKCPRVLSGKNVHADMMRLAATPEEPSLLPETKS